MKELRNEMYRAVHPNRITFGDPYYFESFTGDKLRSLTLDLKVPDWMDVCIVLREDLMEREDYGDDDLFARLSGDELKRRALVIYLAPTKTMQTYLDGMHIPQRDRCHAVKSDITAKVESAGTAFNQSLERILQPDPQGIRVCVHIPMATKTNCHQITFASHCFGYIPQYSILNNTFQAKYKNVSDRMTCHIR